MVNSIGGVTYQFPFLIIFILYICLFWQLTPFHLSSHKNFNSPKNCHFYMEFVNTTKTLFLSENQLYLKVHLQRDPIHNGLKDKDRSCRADDGERLASKHVVGDTTDSPRHQTLHGSLKQHKLYLFSPSTNGSHVRCEMVMQTTHHIFCSWSSMQTTYHILM